MCLLSNYTLTYILVLMRYYILTPNRDFEVILLTDRLECSNPTAATSTRVSSGKLVIFLSMRSFKIFLVPSLVVIVSKSSFASCSFIFMAASAPPPTACARHRYAPVASTSHKQPGCCSSPHVANNPTQLKALFCLL